MILVNGYSKLSGRYLDLGISDFLGYLGIWVFGYFPRVFGYFFRSPIS